MSINHISLLKYTLKQTANPEVQSNINVVKVTTDNTVLTNNHSNTNPTLSSNVNVEFSVNTIGSNLTDKKITEIVSSSTNTSDPTNNKGNLIHSTIDLNNKFHENSSEKINSIKQLIYEYHNPVQKNSFIEEFADAGKFFDYMSSQNPEITRRSGVTRAQLVEFTQNDSWEDRNYDFFGSINRIWHVLNLDEDSVLSYHELKEYFGYELGSDTIEYAQKVNNYTQIIQDEFDSFDIETTEGAIGKLNYAIDLAYEYLDAAGLTYQIEALERLLLQKDTWNDIHVGNIAIAKLNSDEEYESGYITLGAYTQYTYQYKHENAYEHNGELYDISIHGGDIDDEYNDLGITLDISLLQGKWYELVNTLVHELTHATAYRYSPNGNGAIFYTAVNDLHNLGILTDEELSYFEQHWENICSDNCTEEEYEAFMRLIYLQNCAWGEYAAYQVDADYNDSIGQDVYQQIGDNITTAVDGEKEQDTIQNWIQTGYDGFCDENNCNGHQEALPDYKWWSFA